jgi:hypothetical protein
MPETMPSPDNQRADPRKAMFVAADLFVGNASTPVKIRNMSTGGALVEGISLPPQGVAIRLVRGPLSARGKMSWSDGSRGGVALAEAITVEDWIRGKLPAHQVRVDALIAEIRKSGREPRSLHVADLKPTLEQSDIAVETELRTLATLIAGLEDALIDDPHVITHHGDALQKIDEAQQRIGALVRRLSR